MWFLINGILSKSVADGLLSGSLDNILKFQQLKYFIDVCTNIKTVYFIGRLFSPSKYQT